MKATPTIIIDSGGIKSLHKLCENLFNWSYRAYSLGADTQTRHGQKQFQEISHVSAHAWYKRNNY